MRPTRLDNIGKACLFSARLGIPTQGGTVLFSSALIGLREGLEAALVVSILIAFLVKSDQRAALRWVWGGVAAALLVCVAVGTAVAYTIGELRFEQQEVV